MARRSRHVDAERPERNLVTRQQANESDLAGRVPARLSDRPSRHVDIARKLQEAYHPTVTAFEADQSSRVEH